MNKKLAAAIIVIMAAAKKNRKDSCWVRRWVARRPKFGAYASLFTELAIEDPSQYNIYLRMTRSLLKELLSKIGPIISKKSTAYAPPAFFDSEAEDGSVAPGNWRDESSSTSSFFR